MNHEQKKRWAWPAAVLTVVGLLVATAVIPSCALAGEGEVGEYLPGPGPVSLVDFGPPPDGDVFRLSKVDATPAAIIDESPEVTWWLQLLGTDSAATVSRWLLISLLGAFLVAWIGRRAWDSRLRNIASVATQSLLAGIHDTHLNYVAGCKAASMDGKLSVNERKEAESRAISFAVGLAKEKGVDLLKRHGLEVLRVMVDWLVQRLKKGDVPLE